MWRTFTIIGLVLGVSTSAASSQGPKLNSVMRAKLVHAQKILEAVVISDWTGLQSQTRELEQLTNDPRWMVLNYSEYARHSGAFVQAVRALKTAAAERDLEKTPNAYVAMTLKCVECHRYLARARLAD